MNGQPNTGSRTIVPAVIGRPYVGVTVPTGPQGPEGPQGVPGPPGGTILLGVGLAGGNITGGGGAWNLAAPVAGAGSSDLSGETDRAIVPVALASTTRIRAILTMAINPTGNPTSPTTINSGILRAGTTWMPTARPNFRLIITTTGFQNVTFSYVGNAPAGSYNFSVRATVMIAGTGLTMPVFVDWAQLQIENCGPNPALREAPEPEPGTPPD